MITFKTYIGFESPTIVTDIFHRFVQSHATNSRISYIEICITI
jgi:hypothetical protein